MGRGGGGAIVNRLTALTITSAYPDKLSVCMYTYFTSSGGCGYLKPLVGVISHTGPASAPTPGTLCCTPEHTRVLFKSLCVHSCFRQRVRS